MTDSPVSPPEDAMRAELRRAVERLWPGAQVQALSGDASTRRFFRVRWVVPGPAERRESAVVMDYGSPFRDPPDDVALSGVFRQAGLPVARVIGIHDDPGFLAVEDLGDTMLETAITAAAPANARRWLERAVDLAADVASRGTPALAESPRADGPALDAERFRFEMDFFVENYVEGLRGLSGDHGVLRTTLRKLADAAANTPRKVLCHRDFHSRNVMVLPDETLAMVDIQDARWGPDSYDLASLLFDAYVDIDPAWIDPLIDRYVARLPTPPPADFRQRFETVATERMIKALGTFGYQTHVRGNPHYRSAIPRTLSRLHRQAPTLTSQFRDVFQNPV